MKVSPLLHLTVIIVAVSAAYLWLSFDDLQNYSLQIFTLTIVIYLLIRRATAKSIWEVAPKVLSIEAAILSFAFLIIIGATGNFASPIYPLTYAHLLLLVFTTTASSVIAAAFAIVLFHYGLSPELTPLNLWQLASIPVAAIFLLLIKQKYLINKISKTLTKRVYSLIFISIAGIISYQLSQQVVNSTAQAENLRSDSYYIQFSNLNVTSGEKSSSSYSVTDTVGQTGSGAFTGTSYAVGSGFQYLYQIGEFSFSISDIDLDFGELIINQHHTASNILNISTRGASGYSIYAYELHPLRHSNGSDTITDTTCNAGTCSETTAQIWTTATIPGFGFNINGDDTPADFVDSTYFRQFADQSNNETMQVVMSDENLATNQSATVTYKVGVSAQQAAGKYQTGIVYVAVPGF